MNPEPEGKSLVAPSTTYESDPHTPTFSRRTKRDSSYEQLSQIPILTSREDLEIQLEELILNASLEDVLGGDTEEFTPSYNELKQFMLKVMLFHDFVITCLLSNLCISIFSTFSFTRYFFSHFQLDFKFVLRFGPEKSFVRGSFQSFCGI